MQRQHKNIYITPTLAEWSGGNGKFKVANWWRIGDEPLSNYKHYYSASGNNITRSGIRYQKKEGK
jgi:hypothetical protein